VADCSCGKVSQRPPDSTPAATHKLGDRIATVDRTPGVPAKPRTELRAVAVADRNQMDGHSRLAGCSPAAGRKLEADRRRVAGRSRQMGYSPVAARKQKADRRAGLRLRLGPDWKQIQWRAVLPRRQSR